MRAVETFQTCFSYTHPSLTLINSLPLFRTLTYPSSHPVPLSSLSNYIQKDIYMHELYITQMARKAQRSKISNITVFRSGSSSMNNFVRKYVFQSHFFKEKSFILNLFLQLYTSLPLLFLIVYTVH